MNIPKDPHILLSYVNTKLRDEFNTLDDLCKSLSIDQSRLVSMLSMIDYRYAEEQNRFVVSMPVSTSGPSETAAVSDEK